MPNYKIADNPGLASPLSWNGRNLAISADGTLWAAYIRASGLPNLALFVAHSHDNGVTWTEEAVSVDANNYSGPVIAIDSADILHIAYTTKGRAPFPAAWGIFYKQRSVAGVWSAEETVSLQNTGINSPTSSLAIDSSDDVHIGISTKGYGVNSGQWNIVYRKRSAGVWGAVVQITDLATPQSVVAIAVDSVNGVYLTWNGKGWGTHPLRDQIIYAKGPGAWVTEQVVDEDKTDIFASVAVDSGNNPHVLWMNTTEDHLFYSERAIGWSVPLIVDESDGVSASSGCSIAIDRNDDVYVTWSGWPFVPPGLTTNIFYRRRLSGVWQVSVLLTVLADEQVSPNMLWATFPKIAGVSTNILQTRQCFIWEYRNDSIWFGYVGDFAGGPSGRSYALGRRNV